MRRAARRDGNERELVAVAKAFGALWLPVGPLDGWVGYQGRFYPVEIKQGRNGYTPAQVKFLAQCEARGLPVFTWRTELNVFETLGAH